MHGAPIIALMQPVPLDEALAPRLALVAEAMAARVPNCGGWKGYSAAEPLVGRYEHPVELGGAATVTCHRRDHPEATVTLGFLSMVDVQDQKRFPRVVISADIETRRRYNIDLQKGERFEIETEKEFTDTVSFATAAKRAWEVAAKASIGVSYGGITGALEVAGKYGETFDRSDSGTHTERNRQNEKFVFEGPLRTRKELYRTHDRESQTIRAICDFDGKLYWWGGPGADTWEFTTYRSQFLPVIRRTAPAEVYGYREFREAPLTPAQVDALEAPSGLLVEFTVEYDNVTTLDLRDVESA